VFDRKDIEDECSRPDKADPFQHLQEARKMLQERFGCTIFKIITRS
jgi:uncharacterized Zn finger protein